MILRPSTRVLLSLMLLTAAVASSACTTRTGGKAQQAEPWPPLDLAAQARVLDEARSHLDAARPQATVDRLDEVMARHPDSPLLADMRWVRAGAYEQLGRLDEAAQDYRAILRLSPGTDAQRRWLAEQAHQRLVALTPRLKTAARGVLRAILLNPSEIPSAPDRAAWLQRLAQAGINALVLEADTRPVDAAAPKRERASPANDPFVLPAGVYFRTSWAPVVDDLFERLVPQAQAHGMAVYAAISPRRMSWLEPSAGWADTVYDPVAREFRAARALDLSHHGFQQYAEALLTDLVESGVDGVLFRPDPPLGPFEGFSAFALKEFRETFDLDLNPAALFDDGNRVPPAKSTERAATAAESVAREAPNFWRWVGWKARKRLEVLARLGHTLRTSSPGLQVGIELHGEALTDPVDALVAYSEDLVEARRKGFDYFVVPLSATAGRNHSENPRAPEAPVVAGEPPPALSNDPPLARLIELVGHAPRLWLSTPLDAAGAVRNLVLPEGPPMGLPDRIGLMYISPPPPGP